MFLENCKWNSSRPFVCTSAYRGVISAINFMLITSAQSMLRQEQAANPGGGGIDAYNDLLAAQGEQEETERAHAEQGLPVQVSPRELGGMLKAVREHLDAELREHASEVILPLSGKKVLNPWEVGDTVENSLERLIARIPRDLTARMKAEAKALNKSEEVILEALKRQRSNNAAYLSANRELILEIIHGMSFEDPDDVSVEAIWDKLPAMVRFRLLAAADTALYFASDREAQRYIVNGRLESKSNVGLIDGERRVLRREINSFVRENRRAIDEAVSNGAVIPVLQAVPQGAEKEAAAA